MKNSILILTAIIICTSANQLIAGTCAGGTGTTEDPYRIATAQNIYEMSETPQDWDKNFILTNDIDLDPSLPNGKAFTNAIIAYDTAYEDAPESFESTLFSGTFNGNHHTIRNLNIIRYGKGSYLGLFGKTDKDALIHDLNLQNAVLSCKSSWFLGFLVANNEGTIINCNVSGTIEGKDYSRYIGGLAGHNSGIIRHSNALQGTIAVNRASIIGGLVGDNAGGIIDYCSSNLQISPLFGISYGGGLIGLNNGLVSNCVASGDMEMGGYHVGVFIGDNAGAILNCKATGNIRGYDFTRQIGGFVGNNDGTIMFSFQTGNVYPGERSFNSGGFVGFNAGKIIDCYSTGSVNGTDTSKRVGGLVGYNYSGTVINSFSVGIVTGKEYVGGLIGCRGGTWSIPKTSYFLSNSGPDNGLGFPVTEKQMQQQSTFARWDFIGETKNGDNDYWWINETRNFPRLWWQENQGPVADAGIDQDVFAWFDGFAGVTLDGSASSDGDGDLLDYSWSWEIDGESFEVEV